MTTEEKNKAFKECLERISEKFSRVALRERLMLRMAFYAGADLAELEKCELLGIIQGKDKVIKELQHQEQWTILKTKNDLPAPRNNRQVLTWFKEGAGHPAEATILDADRFDVGGGVYAWKEIIPPEEYK